MDGVYVGPVFITDKKYITKTTLKKHCVSCNKKYGKTRTFCKKCNSYDLKLVEIDSQTEIFGSFPDLERLENYESIALELDRTKNYYIKTLDNNLMFNFNNKLEYKTLGFETLMKEFNLRHKTYETDIKKLSEFYGKTTVDFGIIGILGLFPECDKTCCSDYWI